MAKQFLGAHTSLLIRDFLDRNNIVIVFTGLGLLRLFPVPKTQKTHERAEICPHRGKSSRLYRKVLMRRASRIERSAGTSVLCLEHNFILQTAIQDARRCGGHIAITWLHLSNAFGSIPYSTISSIGHLLGLDCRLRPFLSSRGSTTTAPPRLGVPRV